MSAPGWSPPEVYRPGGPAALDHQPLSVRLEKGKRRFFLRSVHPGESVESVRAATGFDYDEDETTPDNCDPDAGPATSFAP